ncbi:helix-turn-helix domain-containing protein, partial [Microbispora rosea]
MDRAVTILEILSRRGEAGVSEVAAEIGVHKSTAFRLLGALEAPVDERREHRVHVVRIQLQVRRRPALGAQDR